MQPLNSPGGLRLRVPKPTDLPWGQVNQQQKPVWEETLKDGRIIRKYNQPDGAISYTITDPSTKKTTGITLSINAAAGKCYVGLPVVGFYNYYICGLKKNNEGVFQPIKDEPPAARRTVIVGYRDNSRYDYEFRALSNSEKNFMRSNLEIFTQFSKIQEEKESFNAINAAIEALK